MFFIKSLFNFFVCNPITKPRSCTFWASSNFIFLVFRSYNLDAGWLINEPLITFRLHDEQASAVNLRNSVNEHFLLEKSLGKHIFWRLHASYQKDILYRHYYVGKIWKRLKGIFSKAESQTVKGL